MDNIFVYLEIEDSVVADVSLELLTKGRSLANQLGCKLEAVAVGDHLETVEKQVFPYGVDVLHIFSDKRLSPYTTLPHASILVNFLKKKSPDCFIGRNCCWTRFGTACVFCSEERTYSRLYFAGNRRSRGCENEKVYKNLLYQIVLLSVEIL